MKKLLSVLLTLTLCLSSCAFADEKTHLVVWHSMSDRAGQLMEEFIRRFNDTVGAEYGIRAEAVYQGAYVDATSKLNNMLMSGQKSDLPDVMQMDATGKVNYFSSGCSYLIDDARKEDAAFDAACSALIDAAMGNWRYRGVQLGVPFATSGTLLYYNKSLCPEAPSTLAQIAALAATMPAETADGQPLTVYADLPNSASLTNWLGQMGSDVVDRENGTAGTATALCCVENGTLERFLAAWKALYASGALKNAEGSLDAFAAGQIAMITASSSKLASLLEKIGGSFELGVGFFPRAAEDARVGSTASGSCLVMFDKGDDEKKAASRLLLAFLTSPSVQAELAAGTGYVPAHKEAENESVYQELLSVYPQHKTALKQLMQTPADMHSITVGPAKDFYYAIQNNVSDMLSYDLTPEETAELMADELNGLLYQYLRANPE